MTTSTFSCTHCREPATRAVGDRNYCEDCYSRLEPAECLRCGFLFMTRDTDAPQCDECGREESAREQAGVDDAREERDEL